MLKKCLPLVLMLFIVSAAVAEDFYVPNPLGDSVLGDWVLYQTSDDGHQRQKMTVVKIEGEDEDMKITVQFDNIVQGKLVNSGKSVHSIDDFSNEMSSDGKPGTTISLRSEEVSIKNKPVLCTVVTVEREGADAAGDGENKQPGLREWYLSEDIPVYGVVRQEEDGEVKSRLIDFGRGKGAREGLVSEELKEE